MGDASRLCMLADVGLLIMAKTGTGQEAGEDTGSVPDIGRFSRVETNNCTAVRPHMASAGGPCGFHCDVLPVK